MFVFDTSAYLNGWHDHLPPATFSSVWDFIAAEMAAGRIITPREVFTELERKDDEVTQWARERRDQFVEPSEDVQRLAGQIYALFPNPGVRDDADPFVIAETQVRGFVVVTYEGRSFDGVPHRRWDKTMPGICRHLNVGCATLPEALTGLGGSF
ncbi:MAG TPA: DUF4411 family protein [Solirubrobacterales bacterium]|nr:DUF4411 family protein [Solirubrobacterales bacterium]